MTTATIEFETATTTGDERVHAIVSVDGMDRGLWWSTEWEWVRHRRHRDLFTDDERSKLTLPVGGSWRRIKDPS